MRTLNDAGLELIKSFEGCKLTAYKDGGGVLTIGYGHTGDDVTEGQVITQDEADDLLRQDVQNKVDGVCRSTAVEINDNQLAALTSFAYNVGLGNLRGSTLLKNLNAGDYDGAAKEFLEWDRIGGKVSPGLLRRRMAEQDLFLKKEEA